MKTTYISGVRALRARLAATGVLGLLDRWAARSRTGLWFRSLLSIYDLEDLLPYDVPWWTFQASDQVEAVLAGQPEARVFEWGSGASTAWLSRRAGSVTSVEHDAAVGRDGPPGAAGERRRPGRRAVAAAAARARSCRRRPGSPASTSRTTSPRWTRPTGPTT